MQDYGKKMVGKKSQEIFITYQLKNSAYLKKKKKIVLGFQVKGLKINIRKFEIFFVQNT